MRIAFLTEMGFEGKISSDHPNMRTEIAWMYALEADHIHIRHYEKVKDYDHVFIIFPKGILNLNAVGAKISNQPNPYSELLKSDWLTILKNSNRKLHYIQEGPHWMFTELETIDQIHFYNMLVEVDTIFAHNISDINYYKGLIHDKAVYTIPTLMIEDNIKDVEWKPDNKCIIGGNFARWYGGFESFIVSQEFQIPIWGQSSHAMRDNEGQLIQHLPRVLWTDWMKQLSKFKYAVHLMPTVAAGTFSLNCAYFGIPCIGNEKVDTQRLCHPMLSVDVSDINKASSLAKLLRTDKDFYSDCSTVSRTNYKYHYSIKNWKYKMYSILKNKI